MPNTTNPTGSDLWPAKDPNGDQLGDKSRMNHAIENLRDGNNHANEPGEIGNTRHMQQLAQNYTPNYDPMRADRPFSDWPEIRKNLMAIKGVADDMRKPEQPATEPQVDELRDAIAEHAFTSMQTFHTPTTAKIHWLLGKEGADELMPLITTKRAEWEREQLESLIKAADDQWEHETVSFLKERLKALKEGK